MFVKPWCKPVLYTCTVQVYCYVFLRPWVVINRLYKLFLPMRWFHVSPIFRCQVRSGRTRGRRMRARMTSARPEAGPRVSPRECSPTSDPQLARGNSRVQGSNQGEILSIFSLLLKYIQMKLDSMARTMARVSHEPNPWMEVFIIIIGKLFYSIFSRLS